MLQLILVIATSLATIHRAPDPIDSTRKHVTSPGGGVRRSTPEEVVTARAPLPNECAGSACRAVTVEWLNPGFMFTNNNGSRSVAIEIWFALKGDCIRARFTIAPYKSSGWGNTGYCKGTYTARFS